MIAGLGPLVVQALAMGAAGVVGDLAVRKVWDNFTEDKEQQAEFPYVLTKLIQVCLNYLGAELKIDGVQGANTTKAVRVFQAMADITVDGIVGPETLKAIVQHMEKETKDDK